MHNEMEKREHNYSEERRQALKREMDLEDVKRNMKERIETLSSDVEFKTINIA